MSASARQDEITAHTVSGHRGERLQEAGGFADHPHLGGSRELLDPGDALRQGRGRLEDTGFVVILRKAKITGQKSVTKPGGVDEPLDGDAPGRAWSVEDRLSGSTTILRWG